MKRLVTPQRPEKWLESAQPFFHFFFHLSLLCGHWFIVKGGLWNFLCHFSYLVIFCFSDWKAMMLWRCCNGLFSHVLGFFVAFSHLLDGIVNLVFFFLLPSLLLFLLLQSKLHFKCWLFHYQKIQLRCIASKF